MDSKIWYIPAKNDRLEKNVGIYCRVSTSERDQLNSLSAQIPALTRAISHVSQWKLSDTFIDIASAKGDSPRREFERMIQECEAHRISVILTKSISRFGRDTVDTLTALNRMKASGVRVIFEEESIDTDDVDSNLLISVMESVAQSENESRSENIRMGLSFRAANGTSGLYKRKLYGYAKTETGELVIDRLRWFVIFSGGISVVTAYWVSLKSYLKQAS
jgi:DNA invertase Pin-like site-specific DNA recombinase